MLRRARSTLQLAPYLTTTAFACLVVLAGWALIDLFLKPDDAVVIEVVPRGDAGQVRVQVEGAVQRPGVYLLTEGSTQADAVAAAGGYLDGAGLPDDESGSLLADGTVVLVPDGDLTGEQAGPLDINTADAGALESLPGIGPALAARIVAYRDEHGPFESVSALSDVSGISERMVDELQGLITTEGS